jgi:hypothetical protein
MTLCRFDDTGIEVMEEEEEWKNEVFYTTYAAPQHTPFASLLLDPAMLMISRLSNVFSGMSSLFLSSGQHTNISSSSCNFGPPASRRHRGHTSSFRHIPRSAFDFGKTPKVSGVKNEKEGKRMRSWISPRHPIGGLASYSAVLFHSPSSKCRCCTLVRCV